MKKFILLFISSLLFACTPQGNVTSEATATLLPTETSIPTPTLHPDFVAVQNLIAGLNENLVLLPDGSIENNGVPIPNLHVDQNGVINIIFNNEHVAIETSQISFDAENGLAIEGYELNENGEWVEAQKIFTLEQLSDMTSDEKMASAPAIAGYSVLRSAERYVIYEGDGGVRDVAYDLTTGEQVEIPQYKMCTPEKFYEFEVSPEDLMNGKYWLWLNTLDVAFDPEKIKFDVPLVARDVTHGGWIKVIEVYHDSGRDKPADFANPSTAPFDRDVTAGVVLYDTEGVKSFGILRPVAFYDKQTKQVNWVIVLESYFNPNRGNSPTSPKFEINLKNWEYNYNTTPLMTNFYTINTGLPDPILSHTYETYPDIEQRFAKFVAGDLSALSAPGLVVQTGSGAHPTTNEYK